MKEEKDLNFVNICIVSVLSIICCICMIVSGILVITGSYDFPLWVGIFEIIFGSVNITLVLSIFILLRILTILEDEKLGSDLSLKLYSLSDNNDLE